jgi:Holliday junction DNA helicase RuvB
MPLNPRFARGQRPTTTTTVTVEVTSPEYDELGNDSPVKRGDRIFEKSDLIPGIENFIGQEMAKKQIQLAIHSAKARGTRLDHVLLASGLAGIGKTTLAMYIAHEMGVGLVECSGRITVDDIQRLTAPMQDGDILFIDECHTVGKGNSSAWLLPLMQDGKLLTPGGPIEIPDITIIGATTDMGKLSEAILSRFMIKPRLTHYELDEATLIVMQFVERMGFTLPFEACEQIAEGANRNPRNIKALVTIARDLYAVYGEVDMNDLFELSGNTPDGLTQDMQHYLIALSGCTNQQASVQTLQALLGEPGPIVHIEKDLMARGYIEVQPRGRQLTVAGLQRVRQLNA